MNTFAKTGRIDLFHLFTKKAVFETSRYEEIGIVTKQPKQVTMSQEKVNLEHEYRGHMVGTMGRNTHYKIFMWSVELGLAEIILEAHQNEGKLIDLLCRWAEGNITHVVIAKKREWEEEDESWSKQEEVVIYSLTAEQKQLITNRIHNDELDRFESAEEFTFKHGYFPVKENKAPLIIEEPCSNCHKDLLSCGCGTEHVNQSEEKCGGCGVKHGENHHENCDWEECPFCHGQLIACGCCYEKLGLDPEEEPVYSEGLTEEQGNEWDKILRENGLVPFGSEIRMLQK